MLRTLGKLELGGKQLVRPKPLVLLAYLDLEGQQSRGHLSQLFWPDAQDPLGTLSVALTRVRQAFPNIIQSDKYTVDSALPTDAKAFSEAAEQRAYKKALQLYQGTFLEDVSLSDWGATLESWVYTTRETLAGHARDCLLQLAQQHADEGHLDLSVNHAERAYTFPAAPPPEADTLTLIYGLLAEGKSELVKTVAAEANELGLKIEDVFSRQIFTGGAKRVRAKRAQLNNSLPPKRSFVGRHAELTTLDDQLSQPTCRLLTLTGMGGVGKSSLALELAHTQFVKGAFRDGVHFIPLESLQAPELIPAQIADVLGLSANAQLSQLELIKPFLAKKQTLLVFDNFEHLATGASFLPALLNVCPELKCLVTSRIRLDLKDEWVFGVEGLAYPEPDENPLEPLLTYDAPELFTRRAKQTSVNLELSETDYLDLAKLCKLTGGLPLALELAAAWLRTISLAEIVTELAQGLGLLSKSFQDGEQRHASIADVILQSWRRLTEEQQTVLLKLSVFEGGFTRSAALQTAAASIDTLRRLIDSSMLDQQPGGRYGFHPLIKQFLGGQLRGNDESYKEAQAQHTYYFLALAETAEPYLISRKQESWLGWLSQELDNLRTALEWSIARKDVDTALRLAGALKEFWLRRSHLREGLRWLSQALELTNEEDKSVRVKALEAAGELAESLGEPSTARRYLEKGLNLSERLGTEEYKASLLRNLGRATQDLGDYPSAQMHYSKGFEISVRTGDRNQELKLLNALGVLAGEQGELWAARPYFYKGLKIAKELGNLNLIATLYSNLAILEFDDGQYEAARSLFQESLLIAKRVHNQQQLVISLNGLGTVEEILGNLGDSQSHYEASLGVAEDLGAKQMAAVIMCNLSNVMRLRGLYTEAQNYIKESLTTGATLDITRVSILSLEIYAELAYTMNRFFLATQLWGNTFSVRQRTEQPLSPEKLRTYNDCLRKAETSLGQETFSTAWEAGQEMTLYETVALALEQ